MSIRTDPAAPTRPSIDWSLDPDRGWAVAVHLIALLFSLAGALLVNLIVGSRSAFVNQHARQAISFQFNIVIASGVALGLGAAYPPLLLLFFPGAIAFVIMPIVAAVRAQRGEWDPYPPMLPLPSALPRPA